MVKIAGVNCALITCFLGSGKYRLFAGAASTFCGDCPYSYVIQQVNRVYLTKCYLWKAADCPSASKLEKNTL